MSLLVVLLTLFVFQTISEIKPQVHNCGSEKDVISVLRFVKLQQINLCCHQFYQCYNKCEEKNKECENHYLSCMRNSCKDNTNGIKLFMCISNSVVLSSQLNEIAKNRNCNKIMSPNIEFAKLTTENPQNNVDSLRSSLVHHTSVIISTATATTTKRELSETESATSTFSTTTTNTKLFSKTELVTSTTSVATTTTTTATTTTTKRELSEKESANITFSNTTTNTKLFSKTELVTTTTSVATTTNARLLSKTELATSTVSTTTSTIKKTTTTTTRILSESKTSSFSVAKTNTRQFSKTELATRSASTATPTTTTTTTTKIVATLTGAMIMAEKRTSPVKTTLAVLAKVLATDVPKLSSKKAVTLISLKKSIPRITESMIRTAKNSIKRKKKP